MTEDHLRTIVRDVIARHLAAAAPAGVGLELAWKAHPSHLRLAVQSGQQLEGPCVVEPAVRCHHCGFCQSLGH